MTENYQPAPESAEINQAYWDGLAERYQTETRISVQDYHYGPLLAGDRELGLLPPIHVGTRCLELGCGAGQNSIYLARQGARCIALDISEEQLEHGRKLATATQVEVDFRVAALDALPDAQALGGPFDLIHSSYALPFADDPAGVIRHCAEKLLAPGGCLLLSVGHPLFTGDWMEFEDGERGMFLADYFHPAADVRPLDEEAETCTRARAWPVSRVCGWIRQAGLQLDQILEPAPLPIPQLSESEMAQRIPYYSPAWAEQFEELNRIPVVLVIRAVAIP